MILIRLLGTHIVAGLRIRIVRDASCECISSSSVGKKSHIANLIYSLGTSACQIILERQDLYCNSAYAGCYLVFVVKTDAAGGVRTSSIAPALLLLAKA